MKSDTVRIGIVGAGAITQRRHLPGFREIEGVRIDAVANRTRQSGERVAKEWGIPRVFDDWRTLVEDPDLDAIVIGTWPNLHCEVTLAALDAGKHVLCQARMARNLDEARRMQAAAKSHPELVTQIVPSPYGLHCHRLVKELIIGGYLGELREIVVIDSSDTCWDYSAPLHWRMDSEISGRNVLSLGILHETVRRWLPAPTQVFAQTSIVEPERPVPDEKRMHRVDVPDMVHVLTREAGGGQGMYHISGVNLFGAGRQIHLYGGRGTIKVEFPDSGEERLYAAHASEQLLKPLEIPESLRSGWRVESDFIDSIRKGKPVTMTDVSTAVDYMEFVEAVALSAERNAPVTLPLPRD